ncbi:S8 family serine peptidase [Deinococcus aestuarii]|uniref:S8 family serine peptidase n=1 Tax=Deinococcus aestuarii TaxID=2774531 RepID=UPI001C0BC13F|nr:S8 family serine peptidase [Deinococcus aestuarii]
MDPLLREQPTHVIVFRDTVPENVELLVRVLGVPPVPDVQVRATRTVLSPVNDVHVRVYTTLGVATAALTPEQAGALRASEAVLSVTPNRTRALPDPPEVAEPGPREQATETALIQIGVREGGPTGAGVKVAVIDTGVDLAHPDLTVLPGNAVSFVPEEPTADDGHGHGTHCAGVVAGRASPGVGVRYGVAPDVTLLVAKALNRQGRGADDGIIDAVAWAEDQGADVISLSLGSPRAAGEPADETFEVVAARLLERGVLLVAAVGNESDRPRHVAPVGHPAACPSVLGVAAVDGRDRVAGFSCGDVDGIGAVDLAAPGVGILSAWRGQGYRRVSGTSMATPHVAGVAALHAQGDPGLTGRALWDRLVRTARPVPTLSREDGGAGVVQAP